MSNPPASLRVRRTQTEILLGPAGICWAPNIDKLCAGHRECTYKDTVSALKNFEVQSRKLTNYQIVIIEMVSAVTQQVQGTLGDTSLGWGGEGRRRKVWFFQEEGAASAKTGHTRTIIHLRTWRCVQLKYWVQVEKWPKVRLERKADQEIVWPWRRIFTFP